MKDNVWEVFGALLEVGQVTSAHILRLDLHTWPHLTAREAGKYSLVLCPGRRGNDFDNQLG